MCIYCCLPILTPALLCRQTNSGDVCSRVVLFSKCHPTSQPSSLSTKLQNTRREKIYNLFARPPLYTLSSGASFSSTDLPIFGSASSKSPSLYPCSVAVPPNIPSSVSFHDEAVPPTS